MSKFLITVVVFLSSQSVLAEGLTDALSKAIQNSDSEKASTRVVLLVTEDHIEKSTFKRGQQKQVIKDESTVISDNSYQAPEVQRSINNNEESAIESLDKEFKQLKH
jgi:hypothetical protein